MTTSCLWHAFRALMLGVVLMMIGAGMATIGNNRFFFIFMLFFGKCIYCIDVTEYVIKTFSLE